MTGAARILVIKLGALGDFVQALGPMAAIRRYHQHAHITLLTTTPYEALARQSAYADEVWVDTRPRWHQPAGWIALARRLRAGNFSRVYDLQNNDRTSFYLRLFGRRRPEWVGAARGASHRNNAPARTAGLAFAGHVQTLALAGIVDVVPDDLSWMTGQFHFDFPYVVLAPGSSPAHPHKRWSAASYGALAAQLSKRGVRSIILGTAAEGVLAATIQQAAPDAVDLCGRTQLTDIPDLARGALGAVCNDTGPAHLIAPTGCPTLVLFSGGSTPSRHAPLGSCVSTLQRDDLTALTVEDVRGSLSLRSF